ncbi:Maintenance of telomere capping protein 5 [Meyerozyma sp. JA9]|nr:Maintenance of telomere capping protein 5 [Meyerozyma sp. JA9]
MDPFSSLTFGRSLSVRVDGAIGAMTLSPNGRDAVLAGRRGLFIIDLEDPFTTPRWLHHITSWEVADVQWSPHQSKPSWCISTSNQKALLWDLARPSNNAIAHVLHQHTRAITDINFHPIDPESLATCSIDTFVLRWDMRTPRKPVAQWAEWRAGATQVKWNHENPWEVASSHDNGFCVWDSRKDALPVVRVQNAHGGKINGLDFTLGVNSFVTCSNDKKVKFWNLSGAPPYAPSVVIAADYPIARARPLPFGRERAVGLMPLRGGDNSVHIVNYDTSYHSSIDTGTTQYIQADPAYSFKGHTAPIKDFLWRTRHENYNGFTSSNRWKDYQLVTWGQDYDLKLWPKDDELYTAANYNPTHQRIIGAIAEEDASGALDQSPKRPLSPSASSPGEEKPNPHQKALLSYDTFCVEPPVSLQDLIKNNNGDKLSALTLFELSKRNLNNTSKSTIAANNLDWISGVRMGHAGHGTNREGDGSPLNLGEEVSIVGHKFPKVRFEKISVSTGDVVLSLVGPVTRKQEETRPKSISEVSNGAGSEKVDDDNEKSSTVNDAATDGGAAATANNTMGGSGGSNAPEGEEESQLVFIRVNIKFPKSYPYLEMASGPSSSWSSAKRNAYLAQHFVSFAIEETHELNKATVDDMVEKLNNISYFYTNKYKKFCLEPCLRFLMGDKVDLDDSNFDIGSNDDEDYVQEVGDEGWADDLINQQPGQSPNDTQLFEEGASSGEDIDELEDLIPTGRDLENSQESFSGKLTNIDERAHVVNNKFYDSTPVPKGCGALWSHTGQLVCFFVPKRTDDDESKNFQKFNIFKFADGEFSVKNRHHESKGQTIHLEAQSSEEISSSDGELDSEGPHGISEKDSDSSSETSDDSFSQDWNDIMEDEMRNNARIPGLFQTSLGLGNRYVAEQKSSLKRFTSQGDGSVNKTSLHDSIITPSAKKSKKSKKNTNIVGIFDFSHLLPDKYELACKYRIQGDRPDVLARYNGEVAASCGYSELAEVWKVLAILLSNGSTTVEYSGGMDSQFMQTSSGKPQNFYWGNHPFGHSGLVKDIFEYFEKRGCIQMLVTMSCVLFDRPHYISNYDPGHTPQISKRRSPLSTPLVRQSPLEGSSVERRMIESGSYLATPALSTPIPFSDYSSPRHYERSINSSVGSSYRESFSEASTMRRAGQGFNLFDDSKAREETGRKNHLKVDKFDISNENINRDPEENSEVTIEMCNVDDLDLFETRHSRSLLDSQDSRKIRLYREHYADMLFSWGLPVHRILVLKFSYPDGELNRSSSSFDIHRLSFGLRNGDRSVPETETVNRFISPSGPMGQAGQLAWRQAYDTIKFCQLCSLVVAKWAVVCNKCEHTLHADCATSWWAESEEAEGFNECPGGCGCHCLYSLK